MITLLIVVFRYLVASLGGCSGKDSVLLTHVVGELDESVGVSPLVIVPGDNLHESRAHLNASLSVEDGGPGVVHEVGRHDGIFSVSKDALEVGLGSFTHLLLNLVHGSILT